MWIWENTLNSILLIMLLLSLSLQVYLLINLVHWLKHLTKDREVGTKQRISQSDAEIGVDKEPFTQDRADGLTVEDVEWAVERGATSEDEIFRMVKDHKELIG